MKKDFPTRPETISEQYCEAVGGFSWYDFVTAMPSLVFVVTGWKSNGKENACLQSWSTFVGGGTDDFICIMSKVNKGGHMYQSLKETGVCVLNFPSNDVYGRCAKTIGNNEFETDEITAAGLTAERAVKVNAPRIKVSNRPAYQSGNRRRTNIWSRRHSSRNGSGSRNNRARRPH